MQEKQQSNNQPRNNEATTNPDLQPPRTQISLTQIPQFGLRQRLYAAMAPGERNQLGLNFHSLCSLNFHDRASLALPSTIITTIGSGPISTFAL